MQSVPINVLENYDLTSMTLEYRRECRQSNLLESLTTSSETLAEDSNSYNNRRPDLEFTHLLRMLADKAEIVRARTKWHSKKKQQEWYDLIHVHQLSLHAFFFHFLFFIFHFPHYDFVSHLLIYFHWWRVWITKKKKKYWLEALILLGMKDETFTKNLLFQSFPQITLRNWTLLMKLKQICCEISSFFIIIN